MLGHMVCCSNINIMRSISGAESDKWLCPPYIFDDYIPQYHNGPSFLIPKFAIPCITSAMWNTPLIPSEDLYTSGILRKTCKVPIENVLKYNGQMRVYPNNDILNALHITSTDYIMYHLGTDSNAIETKFRLHEELTNLYAKG